MPWEVTEEGGRWCVRKKGDDGELAGCHDTREEAERQMRALYANEGGLIAAAAEGWVDEPAASGLALVASDTGRVLLIQRALVDGDPSGGQWEFPGGRRDEGEGCLECAVREFSEEVGVEPPPGRVTASWISSDGVWRGYVWVTDEEASISPRALDADREVEDPDNPRQGNYTEAVAWFDPAHLRGNPKMLRDAVRAHTPWKLIERAAAPGKEAVVAAAGEVVVKVRPELEEGALEAVEAQASGEPAWLTAAAGTARRYPTSAFIPEEDLPGPTPFHEVGDGVWDGHLALWASCHIGLPGCTKPPYEDSFDFYNLGEVITADGRSVGVGKVTISTGHAGPDASWQTAAAHYDNSGTTAVVVRASADRWGIRLSGAEVPNLTDEQREELRRSPLSGDWRRINGRLRLVAALGVNVPGYPVPRALVASGEVQSMTLGFDVEDAAELELEAAALADQLGLSPAAKAKALRAAILG